MPGIAPDDELRRVRGGGEPSSGLRARDRDPDEDDDAAVGDPVQPRGESDGFVGPELQGDVLPDPLFGYQPS